MATKKSASRILPRWTLLFLVSGAGLLCGVPTLARSADATRLAPSNSGRASLGVLTLRMTSPLRAFLPDGEFQLGSSPDEVVKAFAACTNEPLGRLCRVESFAHESPVRRLRLSGFWLDRHEVSVGDYARCAEVGRCEPVPYFKGAVRFDRDDLPVSLVSWDDAQDYCAFVGARLPTEAEFERAARGLGRRQYPWGDLYNNRLSNHGRLASFRADDSDGFAELAPVGSFPAGSTPELVFDLAGNVEEWVSDRYAPEHDPASRLNPQGPSAGQGSSRRVTRGGSYESPASFLRGAFRDSAEPQARSVTRGFRCASSTHSAPPPFGGR